MANDQYNVQITPFYINALPRKVTKMFKIDMCGLTPGVITTVLS